MNSWFRMYGEMIHDPKIGRLSDSEFRAWVSLLCLASNANNDGDTGLSQDDADWAARCNVTETLHKLLDAKLVTITSKKTIKITNWEKRQFKSDKSNERVKKHRQNKQLEKCNVTETLQKQNSNALDTDTDNNNISTNVDIDENPPEANLSPDSAPVICITTAKEKRETVQHRKFIALWNEIMVPMCQEIREWNKSRERSFRARWNSNELRQNFNWWENLLVQIKKSKFLMGQCEPQKGRAPFYLTIDWLLEPKNFTKVVEGYYHRKINHGDAQYSR
jgi:hypothetical protein